MRSSLLARSIAWCLALLASACAGSPPPEPQAPPVVPASPRAEAAEPEPEGLPALEGVPAAGVECQAYLASQVTRCAAADRPAGERSLVSALRAEGPARDAQLAALEACAFWPRGALRGLRAELAPPQCGDVLTEPFVKLPVGELRPDVGDTLRAVALAARLIRIRTAPPELGQPYDRTRFLAFFNTTLVPWLAQKAHAIHVLSTEAAKLRGFARGLAAIEAGSADLYFVELARSIPLPVELAADEELRDVYYGALDRALEPRKARGRDAALVGLRAFARLGATQDPRVDRARGLLVRLYGGRRIDALDELLVPALPPLEPNLDVPARQLAALLPTFYADLLLAPPATIEAADVRAFLERGLPPRLRAALAQTASSVEARVLYARGAFRLGQLYFLASEFRTAHELLSLAPTQADAPASPEQRLMWALAAALKDGPEGAAVMMLQGATFPGGFERVALLEQLSKSRGAFGGYAAYDAAYLLAMTPPRTEARAHFEDVERRFRDAASLLDAPELKQRALSAADAAAATARAIEEETDAGEGPSGG